MKRLVAILAGVMFIAGCSLSSKDDEGRSEERGGTVVTSDPSGITVGGVGSAQDVTSALVKDTPYSFSAVQDGSNVKLVPNQNISLVVGTVYKLLVTTASAQTEYTIKAEMPAGVIMAFKSASCPAGWSVFAPAKGRVLVGAGAGNGDADGTFLTSRTFGDIGGREYTTGIPATTSAGVEAGPSPLKNLGILTSSGRPGEIFVNAAADTTFAGAKQDSNMMPFAVVTYCEKNN